MAQARNSFITFPDKTTIQASEISHISPDKASPNPLWKMLLKSGIVMYLTKSEHDSLLRVLKEDLCTTELIEIEPDDEEEDEEQ